MMFERINFWYSPNVTGKWIPGRWASDREWTISTLDGSPELRMWTYQWTIVVLVIWPMQRWSKLCH